MPVELWERDRRVRRNGRRPSRATLRRHHRGVSDVVATILLLGLTVTLFASIFFFVTSFPSPPAQDSNQFQAALQLNPGGGLITGVTILHLGGPFVAGTDQVYLKGSINTSYSEFMTPYSVSAGIGGAATWNLGQTWTSTPAFPSPLPIIQNITIYVVSPTQLLYSVILPGQAFNAPPTIVRAFNTPVLPSVGAPFTIYAILSGTTSGLTPTVNLATIPGLPATPQTMTVVVGVPNEWMYTVTSGQTLSNGTFYAIISGTNSAGQLATGALSITIVAARGPLLSVIVTINGSPAKAGDTEYWIAYVTYNGMGPSTLLAVSFYANETSGGSLQYSGTGPAGTALGGPTTITVISTTSFPVPSTPSSFEVQVSCTITGPVSAQGTMSFSIP